MTRKQNNKSKRCKMSMQAVSMIDELQTRAEMQNIVRATVQLCNCATLRYELGFSRSTGIWTLTDGDFVVVVIVAAVVCLVTGGWMHRHMAAGGSIGRGAEIRRRVSVADAFHKVSWQGRRQERIESGS